MRISLRLDIEGESAYFILRKCSMKQYLILQLARFGDLVQTKRLVKSLEERGQVHLCVDAGLGALASLLYPKAVVHVVPAHRQADSSMSDSANMLYATIQQLKEIDFYAVYNINYTPLNTSLVRIFSPEIVQGYAMHNGQLLRSPWVQKAFRWTQNRPISPINLVDFWAHFDAKPCLPQAVNPQAKGGGKGIGVVLAGRESRRSLPPTVLAQVVRTCFEVLAQGKEKYPIYLLGSGAELPLARKLQRLLPSSLQCHVQDLCAKTSWKDLCDVLQGLDLLISPDTGTMHLGAHMGVPVQAFFLSSAWCHETGPYGEGHGVWQSVYTCTPCLESAPCALHTKCLEDFSHPSFYRALALHLQGKLDIISEERKPSFMPASLTYQTSRLDALGSGWHVLLGEDPHAEKRLALRTVLAEYCRCPLDDTRRQDMQHMYAMEQHFYEEADWMLRAERVFI